MALLLVIFEQKSIFIVVIINQISVYVYNI